MAEFDFGDIGDILGGLGGIGSAIGGIFGGKSSAKKAAKAQKEALKFAQMQAHNAIAWRVEDAKRAGIHPLAALGANVGSGGFAAPVTDQSYNWGDAIGQGLSAVGNTMSSLGARADMRKQHREAAAAQQAADFENLMDRLNQESMQERQLRMNERLVNAQIMEMTSRTRLAETRARAIGAETGVGTVGPQAKSRTFVYPTGTWNVGPETSAESWSDQYGQLAGEVAGLGNLIGDGYRAVRDWWNKPSDLPYWLQLP